MSLKIGKFYLLEESFTLASIEVTVKDIRTKLSYVLNLDSLEEHTRLIEFLETGNNVNNLRAINQ